MSIPSVPLSAVAWGWLHPCVTAPLQEVSACLSLSGFQPLPPPLIPLDLGMVTDPPLLILSYCTVPSTSTPPYAFVNPRPVIIT